MVVVAGVLERGAAGRPLLDQVVAGILGRMADNNKFVQAAAVSALAVLVETASEGHDAADKLLEPYLKVGVAGRSSVLVLDDAGRVAHPKRYWVTCCKGKAPGARLELRASTAWRTMPCKVHGTRTSARSVRPARRPSWRRWRWR